jgi:hypothetical protein
MTDFCLCCHPEKAHLKGWQCSECNCRYYEPDPYLEAGPDGQPHTIRDTPPEEREPIRLLTDEPNYDHYNGPRGRDADDMMRHTMREAQRLK